MNAASISDIDCEYMTMLYFEQNIRRKIGDNNILQEWQNVIRIYSAEKIYDNICHQDTISYI